MLEELIVALIVGISFGNAFVCIFLAFGMSTVEQRSTGKYFILGRFLGLIVLGLIIATLGLIFDGYMIYFIILFGILTIIFGVLVITTMYYRIKNQKCNSSSFNYNHQHFSFRKLSMSSKMTKYYGFLLGLFRGATPCLKIFILAPLLIIVDFWLAFLIILVFALASTIYPVIGFLSASLLTSLRRYEPYIQITGAIVLISIGVFTILKQFWAQGCIIHI